MRCLVTGGAGFIGSNLCERLLNEGHEVVCYDSFIAGKTENVFHLLSKDLTIVRADVRDSKMLDRAMNGVDIVFHQAASKKNVCDLRPDIDCEVNAKGTLLVLQAAKKHKVKRFIHASNDLSFHSAFTADLYDDIIVYYPMAGINKTLSSVIFHRVAEAELIA